MLQIASLFVWVLHRPRASGEQGLFLIHLRLAGCLGRRLSMKTGWGGRSGGKDPRRWTAEKAQTFAGKDRVGAGRRKEKQVDTKPLSSPAPCDHPSPLSVPWPSSSYIPNIGNGLAHRCVLVSRCLMDILSTSLLLRTWTQFQKTSSLSSTLVAQCGE